MLINYLYLYYDGGYGEIILRELQSQIRQNLSSQLIIYPYEKVSEEKTAD